MSQFTIDNLLRYTLAGGMAAITFLLSFPGGAAAIPRDSGLTDETVVVGTILLIGSVTYVVHRAAIFPLIYKIALLIFWRHGSRGWTHYMPYWVTQEEIDVDKDRWITRARPNSIRQNLSEWSSQVHYLYCTVWAILLGLGVGRLGQLPPRANPPVVKYFCWLAVGLFVAALVHHARLLVYDHYFSEHDV